MATRFQSKTIVLIHGLFVNPKSWEDWKAYFESLGYTCHTPANPYHAGDRDDLWSHVDPRLGEITFKDMVLNAVAFIDTLPEKPIVIGHSVGGLVVQKLISLGKAEAGVAIDSAPPPGVMTAKWSFIKANFPVLNYLKGDTVFFPTKDWFYYAFGNNLPREASDAAFDAYVVPESRNVHRSALFGYARIDMKQPHAPLLFIAGEKDNIIPASLNRTNFNAYKDAASIRDFREFPGRGHFICGEPGWQEVADFVAGWLSSEKE